MFEITEEYKNCVACGYEYQWKNKGVKKGSGRVYEKVIIKGDKDFIKIIGKFAYEENEPYKYVREIDLYMCPKCMTIKGNNFKYNQSINDVLRKINIEINNK
jgi:hypothetical protein